jgi:hypothetical protein
VIEATALAAWEWGELQMQNGVARAFSDEGER